MKTLSEEIILPKGESMNYLDYIIHNSANDDGLVLMKEKGKMYEGHLGNYGTGTKANIDFCKRDAVLHFMLARPQIFAVTLTRKLRKANSGSYHEFFLFKDACKEAGLKLPKEITSGDGMNCMIYFNGKPLTSHE